MAYGLQFQPGAPQNGEQNGGVGANRGRVQAPVQVLSTRLPKFFGSQSIAPASLLQAPGGMGQPGARGNVVAQALAQLAGLPPGMASPTGGMQPPMMAPPPMMPPPMPSLPPPSPPASPSPFLMGMDAPAGGGALPPPPLGLSDFIRQERNLPGGTRPSMPEFFTQPPPPSAPPSAPPPPQRIPPPNTPPPPPPYTPPPSYTPPPPRIIPREEPAPPPAPPPPYTPPPPPQESFYDQVSPQALTNVQPGEGGDDLISFLAQRLFRYK